MEIDHKKVIDFFRDYKNVDMPLEVLERVGHFSYGNLVTEVLSKKGLRVFGSAEIASKIEGVCEHMPIPAVRIENEYHVYHPQSGAYLGHFRTNSIITSK